MSRLRWGGIVAGLVLALNTMLAAQLQQSTDGIAFAPGDIPHLKLYSSFQVDARASTISGTPILWKIESGNGELAAGMTVKAGGPIPSSTTLTQVSVQKFQINYAKNQLTMTTGSAGNATLTFGGPQAPIACSRIKAYMLISTCPSGPTAPGKGCDADGDANIGIPANTYTTADAVFAGSCTVTMSASCSGAECAQTDTGPAFSPIALMNNNATSTVSGALLTINEKTVSATVRGDILLAGQISPQAFTPIVVTAGNVVTNGGVTDVDGSAFHASLPGKLRSIVVTVGGTGGPVPGSVWAEVSVKRSGNTQTILHSGPVTADEPLFWPSPSPPQPLRNTCRLRYKSIAAPPVGGDYEIPIPAGFSWEWITGALLYSTSSAGGDRNALFEVTTREGLQVYYAPVRASMQAGFESVLLVVSQPGGNYASADFMGDAGLFMASLPKIPRIMGGQRAAFHFQQSAVSVTDQFTTAQVLVDECIVGPQAAP